MRILKELGGNIPSLHLNIDRNPYSNYATTAASPTSRGDHTSSLQPSPLGRFGLVLRPAQSNIKAKAEGQKGSMEGVKIMQEPMVVPEAQTERNENDNNGALNIVIGCCLFLVLILGLLVYSAIVIGKLVVHYLIVWVK